MTTHVRTLPHWNCAGCGDAWPCPPRQRELLAEYAGLPKLLRAHMTDQLLEAAAGGLALRHAGELVVRFLGWTTPRLDFTGGNARHDRR